MPINMKWIALLVTGVIAVTVLFMWQDDAVAPAQADIKTTKVSRETLTREVIATGVIRPIVGAEINVGSRVSRYRSKLAGESWRHG